MSEERRLKEVLAQVRMHKTHMTQALCNGAALVSMDRVIVKWDELERFIAARVSDDN